MRQIYEYGKLNPEQLREELVEVTSMLAAAYSDLSAAMSDHQSEYLQAYVREPATSVAAKNRAAQYYCEDLTRQIINLRASINLQIIRRDLLVFLMRGNQPGNVPFPDLAPFDADGLSTVQ